MAKYFIFTILLLFGHCTGINLRTWPYQIAPNTHPAPNYANGNILLKGGWLFHRNSGVRIVGNSAIKREGFSCSHSIFYLFAFGDSRIESAKIQGAVARVAVVESNLLAVLGGAYHRHCTVVRGE